jgi:hypothetical protein
MAQAKRVYQTALSEHEGQEFEQAAAALGVSFSECLRRAVSTFLAAIPTVHVEVTPPAPAPALAPAPLPERKREAPAVIQKKWRKTLPRDGEYLEVYTDPTRPGAFRFIFRWYNEANERRSKSVGGFHDPVRAAKARDDAARILGDEDEPMNFPRPGEVDARTGRVVR